MAERIRKTENKIEHELLSDMDIVTLVRGGEPSYFSVLVRRHQKGLLRLSLRFMRDMDAAEDVVQESFIKSYERLASFEGRASFKSWLYQIAVNTAKNRIRDRRKGTMDIDDVPLAVAPRAESVLVHGAIADLIQKHVDALPIKQRTALFLRVYEDLSFKEIAEIMDCPYDTAKANYRHALMKLKDELSDQADLRHWTEESGFFTELHPQGVEVES